MMRGHCETHARLIWRHRRCGCSPADMLAGTATTVANCASANSLFLPRSTLASCRVAWGIIAFFNPHSVSPRPTGGPRDCPQADSPGNSTPAIHPPPALDRPALAESRCRGLSLSLRSLSLASQMPLPLLHCWLAGNDVAFCCPCISCCCSKTCVQGPAADEEGVVAVLMVRSWTERPRKA